MKANSQTNQMLKDKIYKNIQPHRIKTKSNNQEAQYLKFKYENWGKRTR